MRVGQSTYYSSSNKFKEFLIDAISRMFALCGTKDFFI